MNITSNDAFGFHSVDQLKEFAFFKNADEDKISTVNGVKNIVRIAGLVPGLATIVALVKGIFIEIFINFLNDELAENGSNEKMEQALEFLKGERIRNIAEFTSLGLLLLPIADIITTVSRDKLYNETHESLQPEHTYHQQYVVNEHNYPYDDQVDYNNLVDNQY